MRGNMLAARVFEIIRKDPQSLPTIAEREYNRRGRPAEWTGWTPLTIARYMRAFGCNQIAMEREDTVMSQKKFLDSPHIETFTLGDILIDGM